MGTVVSRHATGRFAIAIAVATIVSLALSLSLAAGTAYASKKGLEYLDMQGNVEPFKGTVKTYIYKGQESPTIFCMDQESQSTKKISRVKSSNKKVATAKLETSKYEGKKRYLITISIKKTGTTKISYKFDGKKYKVTLKVYKYKNPVDTFAVGKTEVAKKFATTPYFKDSKTALPTTGKINIKAKKCWKVKTIGIYSEKKSDIIYVKNGYVLKKGEQLWAVSFKSKKTGVVETLYPAYGIG